MSFQRLSPEAIALLHAWEQAHRAACDAERWVHRRSAHATSTLDALLQSASELRAQADASFRLLLDLQAFGPLDAMPVR